MLADLTVVTLNGTGNTICLGYTHTHLNLMNLSKLQKRCAARVNRT
jgi:hypothetical protein